MGRDITGTVASFRKVDFRNAGIGFVMSMNPAALRGAPHTWIATVYAAPGAEAAILRAQGDREAQVLRAQADRPCCPGRTIGLEMRPTARVCVPSVAAATSMLLWLPAE